MNSIHFLTGYSLYTLNITQKIKGKDDIINKQKKQPNCLIEITSANLLNIYAKP